MLNGDPVSTTFFDPCYQWIGLRENLQETIEFPIKYEVFLQIFP